MTQIKEIDGYTSDGESIARAKVVCRFTSNKLGESLSLQVGNVLIGVAFEDVEKLIEKGRKKK
jgi:hypothetical protein